MNNKNKGLSLKVQALKVGIDVKTARKYLNSGIPYEQMITPHTWRTRKDVFEDVWSEVESLLSFNPGLESKTLFDFLRDKYPEKFSEGQLRTLQRKIKLWRSNSGSPKEVFFPQIHKPGELCASDYTNMNSLKITINNVRFEHLVYHFVLTYSNWETGSVCFSESAESLSEGLQNALWSLGGVPCKHRTDRLSAAVNNNCDKETFTASYESLLSHYGLEGQKIQAGKANENGDVEQSHHRFKNALDQALMLRGSRNFDSRDDYEEFLKELFIKRNKGRVERFKEELTLLRDLPERRLESCKYLYLKVGPSSTINVAHNAYSVDSRLIGEKVEIRLYADKLEIWHSGRKYEKIPRLKGSGKQFIQYRHIIHSLVRKPGAFENCKFFADMFPTSRFKIAYDLIKMKNPSKANSQYLKILYLAATESEEKVNAAIAHLIENEAEINFEQVEKIVKENKALSLPELAYTGNIELGKYDELFHSKEAITL